MHEAQTRETGHDEWQTLHTGTRESAARALRADLARAGVAEADLARRATEAWAGSVVTVPSTGRQFRVTRVDVPAPTLSISEPQRTDAEQTLLNR
ncbi:hypothetical protein [Embleya scabrispora]|uniref:hypothetical protein n=1 Tax=Embleya scabrispora TaxID=159449 RepID=UPI000374ED28|nr:hypothetical protein [Embleya scabrispora]MYS79058.1 hypothetical protein [Streptomyces sp. SID5474]